MDLVYGLVAMGSSSTSESDSLPASSAAAHHVPPPFDIPRSAPAPSYIQTFDYLHTICKHGGEGRPERHPDGDANLKALSCTTQGS